MTAAAKRAKACAKLMDNVHAITAAEGITPSITVAILDDV
jgi:hypothetical protein